MWKKTTPIVILFFLLTIASSISQECNTDDIRPCGSNVGECREGIMICEDGRWSDCYNNKVPIQEICGTGKDEDCDGYTDELECIRESLMECGEGVIPPKGCMCGGMFRTSGYCQAGRFIPEVPEFPWLILTVFGVVVLCIIAIYKIYASTQEADMYGGI